ncbi:hypothetical protein [Streptomyces sp. GS7]|uniref:hypothetical protein n=1 Tax=Streptomyces sp. GS7 TaxID=2692234 RepID=UPI001316E481|nr:hypothetical protein [Streptomyces sp. GS7]QHC21094.1 hypothetical protein GR130_06275 [Streptomyces sp. GS7]
MSISAGAGRSSLRRRAVLTAVATPLLLTSAGAMSQPASASTAPKTITAVTAHHAVPAYECSTLKNWLDHHPANTPEWRKVSLMWADKGCP